MTADPRQLREHAAVLRHGADRLTLLRLRLANTIVDVTRSGDATTRRIGEEVRERWTDQPYLELGRIAAGLRASARRLDRIATVGERTSGRRLGGYEGAGFLGRGDDAHRHVGEVAEFVGTARGASIGGFPLVPAADEGLLAHPSHTLGVATPAYDEDADQE
ncbi:hypothetical protein BH708_18315 [Brachybacterium sp. P6-10-X1]|uniref:hypothetical protein n=1 Tax=Brachybacterium sp. P6-10-X1 TaxID=1903186 RepID=UPI0009719FC4|nr:hypothetical protein [Brachybacterium sp. P6-10-X1]APX34338.1 hypothetical protein BH708_18315 [Brachybacterium sp. P6-10-X1]